ncbi:endoplasmic reticulum-derived transport vesicle ERV46 [Laccaria bicolor S238N-H82]|uniref:Endoplasmic reticulum-derived transport vesicle ERV46 n=1 Tax=Laccaria bicolor (strain S238N-H82 / ATCC MYA-4686) TaxID=486041 RepID=B0DMX3_LACBS|nr:endoplasmic reticulum-derived transport vesicle ERV46 [Laccaria bicolor S238N-H82]EDR04049.1 endoplasmic reticulum-derived transport vesicle ERV46 [Laccaria bicolor S238N-H82]|eukprot:XP_001885304.1 endoplasmic reticulum-derived transport vesicle ERV46 [Laccaria bicolor S238N-H82]
MDVDSSLLDKLDSAVPAPLAKFDAFPKLPSTYKTRTESRGFMTIFVILLAFLLMLNDIGEYIWGWPDFEFSVDDNKSSFLDVNVDLVVNMPCKFISVDLRDAMGDRLYLSGGLRRDGTEFNVGQATALKEHSEALSARQAVSQSRKSRGLFANLFRRNKSNFKPTYNYQPHGNACRVWGSLQVKRVTANLHITTLGHGYASYEHVDHNQMNLSHVITEFSFGPHFPDITQPLDNSFESTDERFVAYQYFLHVVPTTYIAPRSAPLQTHQYSVTHYTRVMQHNQGTPGIFFKFDLDPLAITQHQRTTTFLQLLIRCVGVIGGVFVCMGYAIRITTRAVEVVSGADQTPGIVAAEASGAKVGLRSKWGGGELRARPNTGKMVPQGNYYLKIRILSELGKS